jgi:hypothetical protein
MSLWILLVDSSVSFFLFTQVTGACDEGTTSLLSADEFMVEVQALELSINDVPQQDYCEAVSQGRRCSLQYQKFPQNLQQLCEEADGKYTLSYYMATCDEPSYILQFAVFDEPGCVATACGADDTKTLLELQATASVMARLERGGNFNCTVSGFRNRQPIAQFDKKVVILADPLTTPVPKPATTPAPTPVPTPVPTPAPVQTKKPSTYHYVRPLLTASPTSEAPTVNVKSSAGISSYKLSTLLSAIAAAHLFLF